MNNKTLRHFYVVGAIVIGVFVLHVQATDQHTSQPEINQNEIENNYISNAPETAASHDSLASQYNERSRYYKPQYPHHYNTHGLRPPAGFAPPSRRLFSGKESLKADKYIGPNEQKEYSSYILTAGGKEDIYDDDSIPHHVDVSYPAKYSESEKVPIKKVNFGKSVKKYRYTYSNHRSSNSDNSMLQSAISEQNEHEKLPTALRPEYRTSQTFTRTRGFNGIHPEDNQYAYVVHPHPNRNIHDKTDIHGAKSTSWKQLGPNIEISSSAENPSTGTYLKQIDPSLVDRRKIKQKRKNIPKNLRNGYMTQQHALYVANNLQNFKPSSLKGLFDHSNVLKQSDKFEITDAMIMDAEKEEALKTSSGKEQQKIRVKQESPKREQHNYELPDVHSLQYYGQPPTQFIHPHPDDLNTLHKQYYTSSYIPHQVGAFSKGFVRNIEIETHSGVKKSIPALIIPLTPEYLNGAFYHNEISPVQPPPPVPPLYVNNPEILNPKPKTSVHAFPYEIVNPTRLPPSEVINAIIPVENYQFHQPPPHYQYKLQQAQQADDGYNQYINFQNQNVFQRVPFNYNPSTTPAANLETEKAASPIAFSTQSLIIHTADPQRNGFNGNLQATPPQVRKVTNPQVTLEKIEPEQKEIQYTYEQMNDQKFVAPAEIGYFTTVTNSKEINDEGQSDARRN
ncbi:hypothetical protein PGB90_009530 [Kerria lacca]